MVGLMDETLYRV